MNKNVIMDDTIAVSIYICNYISIIDNDINEDIYLDFSINHCNT